MPDRGPVAEIACLRASCILWGLLAFAVIVGSLLMVAFL